SLIRFLPEIDKSNQYIIYYTSDNDTLPIDRPNVQHRIIPGRSALLWDHVKVPRKMKHDSIDIALFFKGTIPIFRSFKTIVCILDLVYFYPGLRARTFGDSFYMRWITPFSIRQSDAVIAISHNTRNDV